MATYDALHDGIPAWMRSAYWSWVRESLTLRRKGENIYGRPYHAQMLDTDLAEEMCQTLQIPLPDLRRDFVDSAAGKEQLDAALKAISAHPEPLQVADYLLAHGGHGRADVLDALLRRSRSAWVVGNRLDRPGLVRQLPAGVQEVTDDVITRSGRAGARLAQAMQALHGLTPDPTAAYAAAVRAVEAAAIPVVAPHDRDANLSSVLARLEQQGDWRLPLERRGATLVGMVRLLRDGHVATAEHATREEAAVAVALAVTLVDVFSAGLVSRRAT